MAADLLERRRAVLEAALASQGLTIRPDSGLCRAYIHGMLEAYYTPELISFICGLHKYLYEYTDYGLRCSDIIPRLARMLAPSMGSYEAALTYAKKHEVPIIKAETLSKYGLPEIWPWLQTSPKAVAPGSTCVFHNDLSSATNCVR
ncbi:hypothetical protein JKP88DRAFT_163478 [Tribonema minus]|uniref:Uncharacterized protein n=1 Tax=Tribonema minus TaxID=303371 RepID=A0A835Z1M7_9STRA|nr:hypothetical protein JKP88DRAFT_163478 [Tribonema minus]